MQSNDSIHGHGHRHRSLTTLTDTFRQPKPKPTALSTAATNLTPNSVSEAKADAFVHGSQYGSEVARADCLIDAKIRCAEKVLEYRTSQATKKIFARLLIGRNKATLFSH